jgi:TPR repeat protein
MKKKSGSRRRTKVVRRSKKNLRRTGKRKSLAKGRRRPTRRHSRIQGGGDNEFWRVGRRSEIEGDQGNRSNSVIPVRERYDNARNMYNKGAKFGDLDGLKCAYRLGIMYENGKNRYDLVRTKTMESEDNIKAFEWYNSAVSIGNNLKPKFWNGLPEEYADALYRLGTMYQKGRGVAQDDAEAVRFYSLAADQGHAGAQHRLVEMYRLAADKGNADAQFQLGLMFDKGLGVDENHTEAMRLYRLAADEGHAGAQYNLGNMYANGRGVAQDDAEAVRLYRLAADQGLADAQVELGYMVENGDGVDQNQEEAIRLYRLAAAQGHETAKTILKLKKLQFTQG